MFDTQARRYMLGVGVALCAGQVLAAPPLDEAGAVARMKAFLAQGRAPLVAPGPASVLQTGSLLRKQALPGPVPGQKEQGPVPATVMVRLTDPHVQALARANQPLPAATLSRLSEATGVPLAFGRAMAGGGYVLRVGATLNRRQYTALVASLRALPEVADAAADERVRKALTPNDTYYGNQWGLWTPPLDGSESSSYGVDGPTAWGMTTGSTSTVVAVVDTGVGPHPDFSSRLLSGYDFITDPENSNDGNGRDSDASDPGDYHDVGQCDDDDEGGDSSWHGTHVAGIIAARGNDSSGMAGVNWKAKILPVRVLGACGGSTSDILDGVLWAAGFAVPGVPANPTPAHVINMSLGGSGACSSYFQNVVNEVVAAGSLLVVAAGNEGVDAAGSFPGNCEGVLTVGATDQYGYYASYSNYGDVVEISAPGGDISYYEDDAEGIFSTINTGTRGPVSAGYAYYQGTSMATPFVSGTAALMLAVNPALQPSELGYIMRALSTPFNANSTCNQGDCGSGIVNAGMAVAGTLFLRDYLLVYEFYNTDIRHYFRTASAEEANGILLGYAGPGWYDTQDYFVAFNRAMNGAKPVCRFYGTPGIGPNSHFYTVDQAECNYVKANDPGWQYEGIAFYAIPTLAGVCPVNTTPVYRLYNGRWRQNDSNHRYTTSQSIYQQMTAAGWEPEGIAFCGA